MPQQPFSDPEHERFTRESGGEGIVLLKKESQVLPLKQGSSKKIAVLGPLAKHPSAHGGGSASPNSHYTINPFDALTKRLKNTKLTYSKGENIIHMKAVPSY